MHANYQDAHLYIVKRWVLEWLCDSYKEMANFREDILPLLVKLQYKHGMVEKETVKECSGFD